MIPEAKTKILKLLLSFPSTMFVPEFFSLKTIKLENMTEVRNPFSKVNIIDFRLSGVLVSVFHHSCSDLWRKGFLFF